MAKLPLSVFEALVRARSVLQTASSDKPEDLGKPERKRTIDLRIKELTEAMQTVNDHYDQ